MQHLLLLIGRVNHPDCLRQSPQTISRPKNRRGVCDAPIASIECHFQRAHNDRNKKTKNKVEQVIFFTPIK